jgi:hypothetical protein
MSKYYINIKVQILYALIPTNKLLVILPTLSDDFMRFIFFETKVILTKKKTVKFTINCNILFKFCIKCLAPFVIFKCNYP